MSDNGSTPAHNGSRIKSSTNASKRRGSIPTASKTYRYASGGSVTIPATRRAEANSKNNRAILAKELRTARKLAKEGFNVDFSPFGAGHFDIRINGMPAELKKVSSANQIIKHGKKAIFKQSAKEVVFDFSEFSSEHIKELNKLADKHGIHGRYYTPGHSKSRRF